ncbi:hypothetical protein OPT61_g10157 [Boeremia exigua]|uniref:Uncharacterized protein n=1 Tax=Boeremia exigua TaxID=749465 RepID=A0ACC2HQX0_9PLEO|nr:hypothetical protein OPT61_g10157 [Boeremia exigua]
MQPSQRPPDFPSRVSGPTAPPLYGPDPGNVLLKNDGAALTVERNHERITNEARALELVSQRTTVPVPQLLSHGTLPDGRRYLTTQYIKGPRLDTFPGRSCSKPEGQKHTKVLPCKDCSDEAYANALAFIRDTVLPQFTALSSCSRGINGFVMPPSWLSPDTQPPWIGKTHWKTLPRTQPEYVFQYGDLAAQNIIMDPQTLQVKALLDFEYAGFFPPGMENWRHTLDADAYAQRADNTAPLIERFLAAEYQECCDAWHDKAALHELIQQGRFPQPGQTEQGTRIR